MKLHQVNLFWPMIVKYFCFSWIVSHPVHEITGLSTEKIRNVARIQMFLTIRKHDCYTMFETKLLRVLHLFITIGEFLRHCFNSLSIRFPYQWKNVEQKADARDLKKVPTHLGLILCEEQISLPDIANAVVWSIALGVSYFSIYDING